MELEPLQFVNNGYSVVAHYAINDRVQVGANVFAQTLPESFHPLVWNIAGDLLLQARQNLGFNLSVRYFLNRQKPYQGRLVSLPIGYENWTLTSIASRESTGHAFLYVSPRIGYAWFPGRLNFYLLTEAAVLVPLLSDGTQCLGRSSISLKPLILLPGIGLGYRF